jgi:transposase
VRGKPASPVLRGGRRSNAPPLPDRGVRPLKTQQKISGRLTSQDTTQDRLDIRSYIDTARKHGQDVLTVLRGLFTGAPWRPPAPAASPP